MKYTSLSVVALVLATHAAPAFAYQPGNWPGVDAFMNEYDNLPPPSYGGTQEDDGVELFGDDLPSSITQDISLQINTLDSTKVLTRGEFTQLLMRTLFPAASFETCLGRLVYKDQADYTLLFADTGIDHPAAKEICMAMRSGLVTGYKDGTFRPNQPINFAEAAKLLARAYAFTPFPIDTKAVWYRPYVDSLSARNLIPKTITGFTSNVTVADLKEILYRIQFGITWHPALTTEDLIRMGRAKPVSR
jgi:hypothetical protein